MESKYCTSLLSNFETSTCQFCNLLLESKQGVMLQECLHVFCRGCLQFAIQMQKESIEIPCPVWYFENCDGFLTDAEVRELVQPEVYQEYIDRSLLLAKKRMKNVFCCKTEGCSGWCEFENGRKTFICPLCNQTNCMACNAIHTYGVNCDTFKKTLSAPIHQQWGRGCTGVKNVDKELIEKERKSGWGQLMEMVKSGGDSRLIEQMDLIENQAEFECSICFSDIPIGQGVILHECLHMFCKDCLIRLVEFNEDVFVKCPYVDDNDSCWCFLQPREIKALVTEDIYEKHLQRSVKLGESSTENSFHCKTPDCSGWCVFDAGVTKFKCPICQKRNCISCKAIHEGESCIDFQNRIQQNHNDKLSEAVVEHLINKGEYMRCPKCKIPVQKISGCDWLQCAACRTEICWATKGPRWGPLGRGDRSGGCQCSPMRRCHPRCGGCHYY